MVQQPRTTYQTSTVYDNKMIKKPTFTMEVRRRRCRRPRPRRCRCLDLRVCTRARVWLRLPPARSLPTILLRLPLPAASPADLVVMLAHSHGRH